jgi:hypothetical protein
VAGDGLARAAVAVLLLVAVVLAPVVAMIPSRNSVVVRRGWMFDEARFDTCRFISEVVSALPTR